MDPNTTLTAMWKALSDGDIDYARGHAANLIEWIDRGGFPPVGWTPDLERRVRALARG